MTLLELLTVCDAELSGADWWRKEPDPPLIWLALSHKGQHRATAVVSEDERVWAVELFPSPTDVKVWVDEELDHKFPGTAISYSQCLLMARHIMPSDLEFQPPSEEDDDNDPT